jgi:hypothetical protein
MGVGSRRQAAETPLAPTLPSVDDVWNAYVRAVGEPPGGFSTTVLIATDDRSEGRHGTLEIDRPSNARIAGVDRVGTRDRLRRLSAGRRGDAAVRHAFLGRCTALSHSRRAPA